jgi:LmbE family N-acetylglucosaminyl deacetylase
MIAEFHGGDFRAAKIPSPSAASGDGTSGQDESYTTFGPPTIARAEFSQRENFHRQNFHRRKWASLVLLSLLQLFGMSATAETNSPAGILQELKNFRETGRVLYVAAHPDDEDTQLITYLARARHYRTAYLSMTRGDGGQNVLGPEFDSELGVIRTQELLAARRLDGGEQFFTRAIDFGYSKDYRETLRIWDHQQVLSDVVRVIRTFQPDVVIAGFSTNQTPGQHGHHVASAVLAGEAFKLAGDTNAFPDQLTYLKPWQPKRLLQNVRFFGRNSGTPPAGPHVEISGTDPVLGMSYGEIASRSRAMHKSQGFGNFNGIGSGTRTANFIVLGGAPATNDIMDGIDTSWARYEGGVEIAKQTDDIIAKFDANDPDASVNTLLALRTNLAALSVGSIAPGKQKQLDHILRHCLGLSVSTTVSQADLVPGESVTLTTRATASSKHSVLWLGIVCPGKHAIVNPIVDLGTIGSFEQSATVKPQNLNAAVSQPYWLQQEPVAGIFRVTNSKLIGQPENSPAFPVYFLFKVGGQDFQIDDEPVLAETKFGEFEPRRTLKIIPPLSVHCDNEVKLFAPRSETTVSVEITSARANTKGELSLDAPADWKITPGQIPFNLSAAGEKKKITFTVTAPPQATSAQFTTHAKIGDEIYSTDRIEISYPHIPLQLLQPPAKMRAVSLDLAVRGKRIGYVPGAGDSVAEALTQMGYEVSSLKGSELTTNRLKDFDAVVIGVRAFNVRTDLAAQMPALFDFVANGGNVIEQYNRPNDLKTDQLAPYSLKLSGDRVTDENATMTFLAPEHPVLNTPNKITAADFDGWVQERGIYFPNQWDEHWTPILACNDAGEAPLKGSLLVAKYGKGNFIYTGLVFFRELPAGVPGAYRLFANLISIGK